MLSVRHQQPWTLLRRESQGCILMAAPFDLETSHPEADQPANQTNSQTAAMELTTHCPTNARPARCVAGLLAGWQAPPTKCRTAIATRLARGSIAPSTAAQLAPAQRTLRRAARKHTHTHIRRPFTASIRYSKTIHSKASGTEAEGTPLPLGLALSSAARNAKGGVCTRRAH